MNLVSLAPKNLPQPKINLLTKLEKTYGLTAAHASQSAVLVMNPITRAIVSTTPLVAALYKFTIACIISYERLDNGEMYFNDKPVAIGTYDRVKYLILDLDKNAYRDLVD